MAIKVTLRKKYISKGRYSLYLDFYPAILHPETGKSTRRQFLNMYLFIDKVELSKRIAYEKEKGKNVDSLKKLYKEVKPLTPFDKTHNIETLKIALLGSVHHLTSLIYSYH